MGITANEMIKLCLVWLWRWCMQAVVEGATPTFFVWREHMHAQCSILAEPYFVVCVSPLFGSDAVDVFHWLCSRPSRDDDETNQSGNTKEHPEIELFFLEQTSESGLHPVDCVMSMAAAWRYQPAAAGKWSNPKPKSSVRQSLTSNFRSDWLPLCMNLASVIDFLPVVIRMLYSVAVENFFH